MMIHMLLLTKGVNFRMTDYNLLIDYYLIFYKKNVPYNIFGYNRSRKGKVPKRINKAVRERLKREHLNELFIELADTLGKDFTFFSIDLNEKLLELRGCYLAYTSVSMVMLPIVISSFFFFLTHCDI